MILITGAGGQIGRHLIAHWSRKGLPIRAFDLLDRPWFEGHESIIGDLLDPVAVRKAVQGADIVVHLAEAAPSLDMEVRYPGDDYEKRMFEVNLEGTRHLAEEARDAGVQTIIFASTDHVYGPPPKTCPCTEKAAPEPNGPYGRSKWEAEKLLLDMHQRGEIGPIILRISSLLGPYCRDNGFTNRMFDNALKKRPILLYGNGDTLLHHIHVLDVADAIDHCLERPQAIGRIYNIAGRSAATMNQITKAVISTLDSRSIVVTLPKQVFPVVNKVSGMIGNPLLIREFSHDPFAHTCYSIDRAISELGWRPKFDTTQAFTDAALFYRDNR